MSECDTVHLEGTETDHAAAEPTRVFVVDDHAGYRTVATAVIDATPGFVLVGSSSNADEAIDAVLAIEPAPHLILMDINLGERSGVEVTEALIQANPDLAIVFVSALGEDELPPRVQSCGAIGYLPKVTLCPAALEDLRAGAYDWRP